MVRCWGEMGECWGVGVSNEGLGVDVGVVVTGGRSKC